MVKERGKQGTVSAAFKALPQRKSLGQYVYENLKQAIVKGDLVSQSRIVESRVADALGISRTPVREAIHKLEREGLLRQSPTGGFFVEGLTRSDIEETFGIRSVLESYAARLAAIKHRDQELKPLEKKINEFRLNLEQGKTNALLQINTEFHDLLYRLSHSPRLVAMINNLRDHIYRFRLVILKMDDMARKSNEDHILILDFIRKREADKVESLVRDHILRGQEIVLKAFDSQNIG